MAPGQGQVEDLDLPSGQPQESFLYPFPRHWEVVQSDNSHG